MMIEIEQMRNCCVLRSSVAYNQLQEFCIILNSPCTHNIYTRVRLQYLLPTVPNTQSISKQFAECERIVFPRILLALCWEPNFRFWPHKFVGFYLHHKNLQTKHRRFRNDSVGAPTSFKKSCAIDPHP